MPNDRDSVTEPENEFSELARDLGDELLGAAEPAAGGTTSEPVTGKAQPNPRWAAFPAASPIGRVGGQVRGFRRIRWGRPTPPFKSGPFNDDDGCLRGCFYPLGCLFWVLVAILVVVVAVIFWLDGGGDGGDGNLVSGGGIEASPSASASASPAPSAQASPQPSAAPTDEPTATVTEAPTVVGPISVSGTSAWDHPPFARPYSNVGASVLLACLTGDADALAGAIATILFEGAGLSSTSFSGEFDSNGNAVIEVPIVNFGPFMWSADYARLSDGTMLELSGGDSGEVGSDENPDACGS